MDNKKSLFIEIADTPQLRSSGLMHRKVLGDNHGMLFKFPNKDYLRFWMKSTYIPLDIAFLDDDCTVIEIREMFPLSTRMCSSSIPCKLALEVNQGWFKNNGIKVGDKIGNLAKYISNIRLAQDMVNNLPLEVPTEEAEVSPEIEVSLDNKSKVRYAEQHNLPLQIVYQSARSGATLPPRKLFPLSGEGYPIGISEGGDYFTAFDVSPTIQGGDWEILGNQIKRFLFNNIIALEVLEDFSGNNINS